jgi:hypothetical protein
MATDLSRRHFVSAALVCAFTPNTLVNARGQAADLTMLGAWRSDGRDYAGIWYSRTGACGVELPFRPHQVLRDPSAPYHAIAIARRPGEFIARIDLRTRRIVFVR